MSKPAVAKVWTFPSSSGAGSYETLMFVDLTKSCNCPGWTRRTTANGERTCKHTRFVDQGSADHVSSARSDYRPSVRFVSGQGWSDTRAAPARVAVAASSLRKVIPAFGMTARKLS